MKRGCHCVKPCCKPPCQEPGGTSDFFWLLTQVPQTGYVSFTLVPAGTPIGQGGIVPDNTLGLASVTIVKSPGNSGVYGIPPPGAYTGEPSSNLLATAGIQIALMMLLQRQSITPSRTPPLSPESRQL